MYSIDHNKLAAQLNFTPTEKQRYIIDHLKRFNVIVGGKRVGKTKLAAFISLIELLKIEKNIWVVAPQYALAKVIWAYMYDWSAKYMPFLRPNTQMMEIRNQQTGSILALKSADNPVSLKGKGLDLIVGDEVGDWKPGIWHEYIRPNVSEIRPSGEKGKAFLIGNANYFGSEWNNMVNDKNVEGRFSYHLPTAYEKDGKVFSNNPEIVTQEELVQLKKTTPVKDWRQQYLAHFVAGQGIVFSNIMECVADIQQGPKPGRFYYIGIDLGRLQDFSVITVIDSKTFEVVHWERFREIEYPFQKEKIINVINKFGPYNTKVVFDQTGVGLPIVEDLARKGMNIEGITFTNANKKDMVEKLSMLMQNGQLKYPNIPELIHELQVYSYKMTEQGKTVYGAPANFHDDCVTSLFLATSELQGSVIPEKPMTKEELFNRGKSVRNNDLFKNKIITKVPNYRYV